MSVVVRGSSRVSVRVVVVNVGVVDMVRFLSRRLRRSGPLQHDEVAPPQPVMRKVPEEARPYRPHGGLQHPPQ